MFAALAASSLMGSSSRPPSDETLSSTQPSSSNPPAEPSASVPGTVSPTVQHRRSRRLAKQTPAISTEAALAMDDSIPASHLDGGGGSPREPDIESTAPPAEATSSETVVDSELQAEFTDDEDIDAEVFDDEIDHDHSISEKTITLAIAEGLWNHIDNQSILIFTF